MNVFELTAVATPLSGAIAGGFSVTKAGMIPSAAGIGAGFVIGFAVYLAVIGFSALMFRTLGVKAKTVKMHPLEWLASLAGIFAVMGAPFMAWALSALVISRCLHL